jgi:hypothetical protein
MSQQTIYFERPDLQYKIREQVQKLLGHYAGATALFVFGVLSMVGALSSSEQNLATLMCAINSGIFIASGLIKLFGGDD